MSREQFHLQYPPTPPPKSKHKHIFVYVLFVALLIGVATKVFPLISHVGAQGIVHTQAVAPLQINESLLTTQLDAFIDNSTLETGVSIIDLTTSKAYHYGLSDTPYVAASTTKLLSASLFLRSVEQGKARLDEPLGTSIASDQLKKMIVSSDNDAWQAFNDQLGHPALQSYADSLGLLAYDPTTNLITPDDVALLLAKLYQGKLLNSQHTKLLLSYMRQANETMYIGAAIPSGVEFYHKAGYLDDRAMDGAIIDNGKHPYVLVIFTKSPSGSYDQATGDRLFHDITTVTLQIFAR